MFKQFFSNVGKAHRFFKRFPHADTDAGNRFVDIEQAGEMIEKRYGFNEFGNIPWSSFSSAETRIYKAYSERFDSPNPPNLREWIKKLESDYGMKILK